jgi:hypothetical protein
MNVGALTVSSRLLRVTFHKGWSARKTIVGRMVAR